MTNKNVEVMHSSANMNWATPQAFVDSLGVEFDLDACATSDNTKCRRWLSPEDDALTVSWRPGMEDATVWCNPPYGRDIGDWVEKAYQESLNGCTVFLLVPNRTETKWFLRIWSDASLICFVGRRIKFELPDSDGQTAGAPFGSVLAVFGELTSPSEHAEHLSSIGTVILPGCGNIWVYAEEK